MKLIIDNITYDATDSISGVIAFVTTKRDEKLQASDWTQLPDVPLTAEQKAEWATYRQELRDYINNNREQIATQFCTSDEVVVNFPTPPQAE
jgi:IS1 family transposase